MIMADDALIHAVVRSLYYAACNNDTSVMEQILSQFDRGRDEQVRNLTEEVRRLREKETIVMELPKGHPIGMLHDALAKSLRLQSHYAELLNMHDGGQRMTFKTVDEWLARLREVEAAQPKKRDIPT